MSRYGVMTERWGWQPTARIEGGLPTWSWQAGPAGLVTRRQMREAGLAPGGAEPVAQVTCRRGRRIAYLYDRSELVAKRTATPAQLEAVAKAIKARKWCPTGGHYASYCIPVSLGECVDCNEHSSEHTTDTTTDTTAGTAVEAAAAVELDGANRPTGRVPAAGAAVTARPGRCRDGVSQAQVAMGRLRQRGLAEAEHDERAARWHADDEHDRATGRDTDAMEVAS